MTCKQAYEMEKRGYAFLDEDEILDLANHVQIQHPDQWQQSALTRKEKP